MATAAGDLSANAIQMILAGAGLATILANARYGFAVIKWCGAAYLVWMGVRIIISSLNDKGVETAPPTSLGRLWLRGFVTSAANPKAIVFFAALFPQFIDPGSPLLPQMLILGSTYVVIDALFLSMYSGFASWLSNAIQSQYRHLIDRAAGASLIGVAILLALKSPPDLT